MFEVKGKQYDLKFNLKRIELIENAINGSLVAVLASTNGMLPIGALKATLAYTMKETGSDSFVSFKQGQEMAESLIEANGYTSVVTEVIEAVQRDCGFLFQEG